ncbi:hypothetical protein B6D60_11570, partial [candidate division KSB1 bacterium 4484_87]
MKRFLWLFIIFFLSLLSNLQAQGYILAVGGGREDYGDWSDAPYRWMVEKAEFGKIINIDVDATSNWYPAYFIHFGAAAESRALQIPDRESANSDAVYQELKSAKGIFIEGGNQWDYVSVWKGTKVQQAIREIFQQGGVIGGTSAGLAVLGDVVFDAKYGSALPQKAVYDAYIPQIHFEKNFLNLLPNILTDSHFTMRGRLGRLVPMLARLHIENPEIEFIGLGIDENTAICIDPGLNGKVFGEATVTVLYKTGNSQINCSPGHLPTFTAIGYDQLIEGCVYDLKNKKLVDPGPYLNQTSNPPTSPEFQELTLDGSSESTADAGSVVIENLFSRTTAAFYGQLTQRTGQNYLPNSIIMPRLWSERDYFENRLAGAQWGVSSHPHFTAILIDEYNQIQIDQNGILSTNYIVHILDGYGMTYSGINSRGCQIPGIIGARLHFMTKKNS